MRLHTLLGVLLIICSYRPTNGASILALFSSLSFSDHAVYRGFVTLLTKKGHSVVMMTPYPGQFQYPEVENIIELDVGGESAVFWDEFKAMMTNTDDYYPKQRAIDELLLKIAISQLKSKQMISLLVNSQLKFDLVITEADVPVFYAIADKYKAPLIALSTSSGRIHQHESKGNPIHPVLYLDVNSLNTGRGMTRWQKITEFYRLFRLRNEYYYNYLPLNELAAQKFFGLQRSLQDVEYDIDLLFIATNPILDGNRPKVPAVIHVDRMHIRPLGHLPQSLQADLDAAKKGAIYFSLGALQDPEQLSPALLKTITDTFSELPYTVFWRVGNTSSITVPNNVIAKTWFPQQDLLAHPNIKAFITSGGPRSLEEAVYFQVPIIGFPLLKPRKNFIAQITKFGCGEILDPYQLDRNTFKSTIIQVATNETYKKSMSSLKDKVFDPMISGPENAVWWVEYLLRHKDAKHLRSPAVGVGFIKYFMLDIIFYVTVGCSVTMFLTYLIIRLTVRKLRVRFSKSSESESKFKIL